MSILFIKDVLKLSRPYQYSKNLFVFLPAFFSFQLTNWSVMQQAIIAFSAFSLIASSVYIFNDWIDKEADANHPVKCSRPIAAGRLGNITVFTVLTLFLLGGAMTTLVVSTQALVYVAIYLLLNLGYSLRLKHVAIIDIVIIASGFVLRLLVGSAATHVALSHWIIVMTFLLALFLSLAKRRDDVLIYINTEQKMRKVVDGYNLKFLDAAMMMTASIVVIAYILWSISPEVSERLSSENLYLSAIFVILGIMRYMQIAFVEERSGNPSKVLLEDRFIQLTLAGWLGTFFCILYVI